MICLHKWSTKSSWIWPCRLCPINVKHEAGCCLWCCYFPSLLYPTTPPPHTHTHLAVNFALSMQNMNPSVVRGIVIIPSPHTHTPKPISNHIGCVLPMPKMNSNVVTSVSITLPLPYSPTDTPKLHPLHTLILHLTDDCVLWMPNINPSPYCQWYGSYPPLPHTPNEPTSYRRLCSINAKHESQCC